MRYPRAAEIPLRSNTVRAGVAYEQLADKRSGKAIVPGGAGWLAGSGFPDRDFAVLCPLLRLGRDPTKQAQSRCVKGTFCIIHRMPVNSTTGRAWECRFHFAVLQYERGCLGCWDTFRVQITSFCPVAAERASHCKTKLARPKNVSEVVSFATSPEGP
jgi:hypothetical protein